MKGKYLWLLMFVGVTIALLGGLYAAFDSTAYAQSPEAFEVSEAVTAQSSPAVRDLPSVSGAEFGSGEPFEINPRFKNPLGPSPTSPQQVDPALQPQAEEATTMTPLPAQSFDGMTGDGIGATWSPPDISGDVGPNHYVQMINSHLAIFDKQGNRLAGPAPINQLWRGQNDPCGRNNDGDPIVLYDQIADRWLLSQFAHTGGPPYYECIAISQTPDPTGTFHLYAFNVGKDFPDYPKLGVWPDAYYMTTNSTSFGAFAFDRNKMLQGQPGTFQRFNAFDNFMLPADLDGPTPPPPGAPNYFYTTNNNNQLKMWAFKVDFANPANSSFTALPDLAAAPYNFTSGDLIPQKDSGQRLDSIAEWPMWRFAYRNFGAYESLVGNFSVDADGAGRIGIRWFELRKVGNGAWQIHQQGTYAPADTNHRWMGSIAMDKAGNIALGYNVSGPELYPSIRYATRAAGDPLNTLQAEQTLVAGGASQEGSNRWGDYNTMSVDPADDSTFWFTGEYYAAGEQNWRTRIGAFRIEAVGTPTLKITKTVVTQNTPVRRGDAITYTIEVRNQSGANATNVVVGDDLPQHVVGTNLNQTVAIAAGQTSVFTIPAVLSNAAPYNAIIINTAFYTHTSGAGQSSASLRVEPAPPGSLPNLVSSFALTPPNPRANQEVLVTLLVTNTGASTAENFFVDFYINPARAPVTATDWIELAGNEIVQGIEWEVASLAASKSMTLTSDGSSGGQAPDPGFTIWNGYLPAGTKDLYSYADSFNYGDPDGAVAESNEQDNSFYLELTTLTPTLDIDLDAPSSVRLEEGIVYTLTVHNRSEIALTSVVVTDRIPAGTVFVNADNGGTEQGGVVTWQIAQLNPNQLLPLHMTVRAERYYSLSTAQTLAAVRPSVLGGITSTVGAWPWQAALIDTSAPNDLTGQYCGGTLIEKGWVLTAASCVAGYSPSEIAVVLGRNLLSAPGGQRISIAEIVVHPDYKVTQQGVAKDAIYIDENDIALLRLATPATIDGQVAPVALLTSAEVSGATLVLPGANAVVTGWGNRSGANDGSDYPDALHEVVVPVVSNQACQIAYGDKFTVTGGMICAGVPLGGFDSCPGDEGGPLAVQDGAGKWLQAGITSFKYGRGCGKANQYGVYTRVSHYTGWVESGMNTVTNDDYHVTSAQGFRATGEFILETRVMATNKIHLPAVQR